MGKFFKLGDIAAFVGSLGLPASLVYLTVVLPGFSAVALPMWCHGLLGVLGLVLSTLALRGGLASLQIRRNLYRPNLGEESHKWLAVAELVGGGILAVISSAGLAGLWNVSLVLTPMLVMGVPLGIFAVWFGIHLLQCEPEPSPNPAAQ